jgi:single-strand DNA-binding protein
MLIGNLTRDPELRYTPNGTAVCSFSVATNRSWTPSDGGERKEETEFHRIVAWNKLAELCSQLLNKGKKVYVEGRLQTRSWETPEGGKRYATEVVAEDMVILDSRRATEEAEGKEAEEIKEQPEEVKEPEETKETEKEDKKEEKEAKKEFKSKEKETKPAAKEDELGGEIDVDDIPF